MNRKILVALLAIFVLACSPDNDIPQPGCGPAAKIDATLYAATNTSNYSITHASINGNCLEITFGASGCNGSTWLTELVDAEAITKSNPPQRMLKLKLTNNELCAAAFSKTVEFDISGLKVNGTNTVHFMLAGYSDQLTYQY